MANRHARVQAAVFGIAAALIPSVGAQAAQIVWSGAVSSDFEDAGNWVGGVVPTNNTTTDFAVFDAAAPNQPTLTANRSIGGLTFKSSGWTLGGSGFVLTKGIQATYAIELQAPGTVTIDPDITTANWSGFKVPAGATVVMNGKLTATSEGLAAYTGTGTIRLAGSQSNSVGRAPYDGGSSVTWELAKTGGATAWTGNAIIRNNTTFRWFESNQIPGTPQGTMGGTSTYDLNGYNQTFSQLVIQGGAPANTAATVTTGTGTATLSYMIPLEVGRTDMAAPFSISGNVAFTGGGQISVKRTAALAYDLDLQAAITSSNHNLSVTGGGITRFASATGNTYTRSTTVQNSSTLLTANTSGSATGTGNVTVQTSSTLAGDGIVVPGAGNKLTIQSTGTLAPSPGDSIAGVGGLVVSGDVQLDAGGRFSFDLGNAGAADHLEVGNLTLGGDLYLSQLPATTLGGSYVLADYAGTLNGVFTGVYYNDALVTDPTGDGVNGYVLDYGDGSNDQITLTAVPEPAGLSLLALGGLLLSRRTRRGN